MGIRYDKDDCMNSRYKIRLTKDVTEEFGRCIA